MEIEIEIQEEEQEPITLICDICNDEFTPVEDELWCSYNCASGG